jgi:hypothetical protein
LECFPSENEDGGTYPPPELVIEIQNGNIKISFLHGRYGYWSYIFRKTKSDFQLIGYNESNNQGPIVNEFTSINFLTKKIQTRKNVSTSREVGVEKFKISWKKFIIENPIFLSEIKNFDQFDIRNLIRIVK